MRDVREMKGGHLAEIAELSVTQISRIESGATTTPTAATLKRLARALNFNHRPLMILAGHTTGPEARSELMVVLHEHRSDYSFWDGCSEFSYDEAMAIVSDPNASDDQLYDVAGEIAIWADAEGSAEDLPAAAITDPQLRDVVEIWARIGDSHRDMIVGYVQAVRDVHDLEQSAQQRRLILEADVMSRAPSDALFSESDLRARGFEGFVALHSLTRGLAGIPRTSGSYVVLRRISELPEFLEQSVGGHYKSKDPTVPTQTLEARWVQSSTLYIGRSTELRTRLNTLARFARGDAVAHWGGRYLFQIADCDQLLVCWREDPDHKAAEAELLKEFRGEFGCLPFANIQGPGRS